MSVSKAPAGRITSLDQFRGYTVAGMFLVNFVGSFAVTPLVLRHSNTYCSYADTIMPQFFFAVGFAYRLSFGRRAHSQGMLAAYGHVVRRLAGLALLSLVVDPMGRPAETWSQFQELGFWGVMRGPLHGGLFGTLMHIALTSLWITPVIRAGITVRVAYMLASAGLQMALSHWYYFEWVHHGGVDGGPFGFLSWSIPTIMGTVACDWVAHETGPQLGRVFAWSAVLMILGYALSCGSTLYDIQPGESLDVADNPRANDPVWPRPQRLETHKLGLVEPPFVPPPGPDQREHNYWMMSQRAATISYHFFAAGFALAVYGLFYIACDIGHWSLGLFRTLGTNALAGYVLHGMVASAVRPFAPNDSPVWYVCLAFAVYFGITYLFVRHLEKSGIYLKL